MTGIQRLPDGARLLHIGPHKTGSTALQDACDQARDELKAQGTLYLSRNRHESLPARYITDRLVEGQSVGKAERRWNRLVADLREPVPARRFYSSEFLSDATGEQAERIIDEIGDHNLHVAVTLRPLATIVPSQYQQYIFRGATYPFDSWLDSMFNKAPYLKPSPTFWQRHRHDHLVQRWVRCVGKERLVVVMLDSRDFGFAPRAFEGLLGLSEGTLADKAVNANRSMTWAEAEVVGRFNKQVRPTGMPSSLRMNIMRSIATQLKARTPGPDERKISAPAWAVRRANEIGAEMAEVIESTGVRIIGDLSLMSSVPVPAEPVAQPTSIDLEIAALMLAGSALATVQEVERVTTGTEPHDTGTVDPDRSEG